MIVPVSHPIQNVLHRDGLTESPYQFCKEGGYGGQHAKFDELIQALRDSDNAEDLLGGAQKPTTEDQVVAAYVEAAQKLGLALTAEDVAEGIEAMAQERLAKTEQAEAVVREFSMDELDAVAGGGSGYDECKDTFADYENCWLTDACDNTFLFYPGYLCKREHTGIIKG